MRPTLRAVIGTAIGVCLTAPGHAQIPSPDRAALAATGILERLAERTGVYGLPPTAKTPGFLPTRDGRRSCRTIGSSAKLVVSTSRPTTTSGSTSGRAR